MIQNTKNRNVIIFGLVLLVVILLGKPLGLNLWYDATPPEIISTYPINGQSYSIVREFQVSVKDPESGVSRVEAFVPTPYPTTVTLQASAQNADTRYPTTWAAKLSTTDQLKAGTQKTEQSITFIATNGVGDSSTSIVIFTLDPAMVDQPPPIVPPPTTTVSPTTTTFRTTGTFMVNTVLLVAILTAGTFMVITLIRRRREL